jgi:hypothetical protein
MLLTVGSHDCRRYCMAHNWDSSERVTKRGHVSRCFHAVSSVRHSKGWRRLSVEASRSDKSIRSRFRLPTPTSTRNQQHGAYVVSDAPRSMATMPTFWTGRHVLLAPAPIPLNGPLRRPRTPLFRRMLQILEHQVEDQVEADTGSSVQHGSGNHENLPSTVPEPSTGATAAASNRWHVDEMWRVPLGSFGSRNVVNKKLLACSCCADLYQVLQTHPEALDAVNLSTALQRLAHFRKDLQVRSTFFIASNMRRAHLIVRRGHVELVLRRHPVATRRLPAECQSNTAKASGRR